MGYFGWMEMAGTLFSVVGDRWENILGWWGWMGMSAGECG